MSSDAAAIYYTRYYPDSQLAADAFFVEQRRSSAAPYLARLLKPGMKVLDYGAGPGGKTADLIDKGISVAAHDLNPGYLEFARAKGLMEFTPEDRFDCLYLSHTIEHWTNLFTDLQSLVRRNLKPGGIVVIEVPLLDRLLLGHKRDGIHAEIQLVHTWYFAVHTLDKLLRQLECVRFDTDRVTVCAYRHIPGLEPEPVRASRFHDTLLEKAISVCSYPVVAPLIRAVNRVVRYVDVYRSMTR